jgi:hypothetical protein
MTDDQIERAIARKTDRLDARYMAEGNTMTKAEYDAGIKAISDWAEAEYRWNRWEPRP